LRTTPLASALKTKYPQGRLTWLTASDAVPLLKGNPAIDRLLDYSPGSLMELLPQKYDLAICLDKEPQAAGLAALIRARRKCGFGLNDLGQLIPLEKGSKHLYQLGLSNRMKFEENQKSYQQLIIEACGLEYTGQPYVLVLDDSELTWACRQLGKYPLLKNKRFLVGVNTGTGRAFPTKSWPKDHFVKLFRLLSRHKDLGLLLLGGPDERELNHLLLKTCPGLVTPGTGLELRQFAALIAKLDLVVSADTLGMHLGIALGRKTLALFGPTCSQEIDLYQKGEKLQAGAKCAPCYKTCCPDPICMSGISPESVLDSVLGLLDK